MRVTVSSAGTWSIIGGNGQRTKLKLVGGTGTAYFCLDPDSAKWNVVIPRDLDLAFSTPVFVRADGDVEFEVTHS